MSRSSPSVSQSLLELFATVRQQAEQYSAVYDALLRKAYELDRLRAEAYQDFDRLKHAAEELQQELRSRVDSYLNDFQQRYHLVEELAGKLEQMEQLRARLVELEERLTKRTLELDTVLMTIRHMVNTATDERFQRLEDYIANKIRAIEQDVGTLDSHVYAMQEFFKKEIADLSEELARYKKKVPETRYILDETNKYIVSLLEEAERRFQDKLNESTAQVEERISQVVGRLLSDVNLSTDILRANATAQEMLKRAELLERKMSLVMWISLGLGGVALILALITILT